MRKSVNFRGKISRQGNNLFIQIPKHYHGDVEHRALYEISLTLLSRPRK